MSQIDNENKTRIFDKSEIREASGAPANLVYNGDEPYIFISYAHKDSEIVLPVVRAMQQKGYRVWLDLGIEVGTEWSNNIAAHLRECAVFVAFISSNSVKSENCLDEIAYAKSNMKDSLMIFLEDDVALPEGTEMQTARFQRMFLTRQESVEGFMSSIEQAPIFAPCIGEAPRSAAPSISNKPIVLPEKNKKNSKSWIYIVIAAVVAVAIIVGMIFVFKGCGKGNSPTDDNKTSTVVKMSDNILDCTFKLEGKTYQLPLDFSELEKGGWTIQSSGYSSKTLIDGMSDDSFYMVKDGKEIMVAVYNNSGNALPISKCSVVEISVQVKEEVDFEVAKGIKPGASIEDIISAFGTPNTRNSSNDYETLRYEKESYGQSGVIFVCYKNAEDSEYSQIHLKRYEEPKDTSGQTKKDVPKYLSDYKAPQKLGNDITAGIIEIDGDLYQFPAPVSAFTDNGWKIIDGPGYVVAGGDGSIGLSRDDITIELDIVNMAEYQTIPKNCAVVSITVDEEEQNAVLPGQVKVGLDKATLESRLPDNMEINDGTYTVMYSYYEYKPRDLTVYVSLDKETGKASYIRLKNETWNY